MARGIPRRSLTSSELDRERRRVPSPCDARQHALTLSTRPKNRLCLNSLVASNGLAPRVPTCRTHPSALSRSRSVYYLSRRRKQPVTSDAWRPVAGYPNYQVSCRGEVMSLVRNRLLAQAHGKRGYLLVNLYRDGKPTNALVHRLVAAAFIGVIPDGWQVNHKDG